MNLPDEWEALTPSEHKVVDLVCMGLVYREVADELVLSRRTVETHVANAFRKLGVRSRNELESRYAADGIGHLSDR